MIRRAGWQRYVCVCLVMDVWCFVFVFGMFCLVFLFALFVFVSLFLCFFGPFISFITNLLFLSQAITRLIVDLIRKREPTMINEGRDWAVTVAKQMAVLVECGTLTAAVHRHILAWVTRALALVLASMDRNGGLEHICVGDTTNLGQFALNIVSSDKLFSVDGELLPFFFICLSELFRFVCLFVIVVVVVVVVVVGGVVVSYFAALSSPFSHCCSPSSIC